MKRFGGTQKYSAQVLGVGHDCDLALLTVAEEDFWKDAASPLVLGDIPVRSISHLFIISNTFAISIYKIQSQW